MRPRALVLIAVAFAAGLLSAWYITRPAPPPVTAAPLPRVAGDFTLVDARGEPVRWSALDGQLQLVFFGFTHCPEACPTTLALASQALAGLGERARGLPLRLISVDPERDTPERMAAYAAGFGPAVTGFTGDAAAIAAAAAAFHVYYEKPPPMEDGSYMVNHTATLFLIGAGDEILEILPYGSSAAEIAAAIERHL